MKTSLTLLLITVTFTSLTASNPTTEKGKSLEALMIETTTENSSDTFPTTKNPIDQPCDSGTTCLLCCSVNCFVCWGPDSKYYKKINKFLPKESTCPKKNFPWL